MLDEMRAALLGCTLVQYDAALGGTSSAYEGNSAWYYGPVLLARVSYGSRRSVSGPPLNAAETAAAPER